MGAGVGGGIEQKRKKPMDMGNCGGCWGEVEEDGGGINGDGQTIQCADNVLLNCAPETCIILLTSVTPINSVKRKRKKLLDEKLFLLSGAPQCQVLEGRREAIS